MPLFACADLSLCPYYNTNYNSYRERVISPMKLMSSQVTKKDSKLHNSILSPAVSSRHRDTSVARYNNTSGESHTNSIVVNCLCFYETNSIFLTQNATFRIIDSSSNRIQFHHLIRMFFCFFLHFINRSYCLNHLNYFS